MIALLGFIVLLVVYFTQENIIRTYSEKLPYISLGDNIKNKTTKGHLWFEEFMAGDESINFQKDILVLFDTSKYILTDAIEGRENELGKFTKNDDAEVNAIINTSLKELESLISFTNLREKNKREKEKRIAEMALDTSLQAITNSGEEAGGEIDQQFDAAYERVQAALDELILHVNNEVKEDVSKIEFQAFLTVCVLLILFTALCFFIYRIQRKNERTEATNKEHYEKEMLRIEQMTSFVESIAGGNLDSEIKLNIENDHLARTLVNMRDNLKKVALEDERRNWANEGFAKFGEILRNDNDNLEKLAGNILSNIIKYTKANQGALFVINDDNQNDTYLELLSCYAWGRKKFLQTRVQLGEGLIGQCWQEQEKIYLTEVPGNFIKITSGVGEANPDCILIVPLKINEKIYGIIEMASFKQFEPYHIEFVEKFAESVASAISSVKINDRTKKLLEISQQQSEEMKAQEEEMRQNMEELQATQEEMQRKNKEIETQATLQKMETQKIVEQFQKAEEALKAKIIELENSKK
jgi:cbb3-type cytochrome oxidase subunit 3